jgi:hypothetical protein
MLISFNAVDSDSSLFGRDNALGWSTLNDSCDNTFVSVFPPNVSMLIIIKAKDIFVFTLYVKQIENQNLLSK